MTGFLEMALFTVKEKEEEEAKEDKTWSHQHSDTLWKEAQSYEAQKSNSVEWLFEFHIEVIQTKKPDYTLA